MELKKRWTMEKDFRNRHSQKSISWGGSLLLILGMLLLAQAVSAANSDSLGLANGKNILFVDKDNSNCNDGFTRTQALSGQTPWCSIDAAASKMQSGDTVYVLDGTYRSTGPVTINGKSFSKKTTITAYPNDHPVLTTAIASLESAPNSKWTFAGDSSHNLWYTSYTRTTSNEFVGRYTDTGISLFTYSTSFSVHKSLSELENTQNPEGLFYDSGSKRIYIRFDDLKKNPNNIRLSISENIGFDVENVDGAGLEISGFTVQDCFRNIYVKNSDNVIIKDNTAIGGIFSIDVRSSGNVVVQGNEVEMSPGSDWTWSDDTKRSAMETSGICLIDDLDNLDVSGNLVHGYFNGIYVFTQKTGKFKDIQLYDNTVHDIYDDGIEIEDYCNGGKFYRNKVNDAFVAMSLSPVDASQKACKVYNNILVADKKIKWDHSGTEYFGECYKVIDSISLKDVTFESNTCIGKGVYTTSSNSHTQEDTNWINNIFYSASDKALEKSGLASQGVIYDYNIYYRKNSGPLFQYWNSDSDSTQFNTLAAALSSRNNPGNWDRHSKNVDPLFNDIQGGDYRPKSNSQACSMSTTGSYVGALPCVGQEPSFCGDGFCSADEDCDSCSFDCGECNSYCGDGTCDSDENCGSCSQDCGACPPPQEYCGDGTCNADESCSSCSQDCGACPPPQEYCGDGTCDADEDCSSCSQDCGTCQPYCGDGDCSSNEDCNSCSKDCGTCLSYCGDDKCNSNEDCSSCSQDCGTCQPYCGDGICNLNEKCSSCSQDCGACPADEYHWLESEIPVEIQSPMTIQTNDTASNSQYIYVPPDQQGNNGESSYTVNINEPGDYIIWGRVIAPAGDQNSFFVNVDNKGDNLWELDLTSSWKWQEVNNRDVVDPAVFTLTKGTHTISIKQRESNSKIDKIFLTNDFGYSPSGMGQEAENLNECGDGVCDINEDCTSCSQDCGTCPSFCGDGACDPNENCNSCSNDCGVCPPAQSFCGDGTCNPNENCHTCSKDCGSCQSYCGDGNCNSGESCNSCSKDCGTCQAYCGDGTCDSNEDCSSCNNDCGTCSVGEMHWLESESPDDLTWPMKVSSDSKASNGGFIYVPNELGYNGKATYNVNIKKAGDYLLWGRVIGPGPYDDSFFVEIDSKGLNLWDMGGQTSWNWQVVRNRGDKDAKVFSLSKGAHTISIRQREDGAKIDKLLLTSDKHYTPSGMGESAENIKYCGDGTCSSEENCNSCSKDCGTCKAFCGDGACSSDEDCSTCGQDCGECEEKSASSGGSSKSSGGGGGGSGPPISGTMKESEFVSNEILFTGGYRDSVGFSIDDEKHMLKIVELNSKLVKVMINSTPIEDTINAYETKSYDIQGDELDDIEVTLESINSGKATIRISLLDRQALLDRIAKPDNDTPVDENDSPEEDYVLYGLNEKPKQQETPEDQPNGSSLAGITGAATSNQGHPTARIFSLSIFLFFVSGLLVFLFFRLDAGTHFREYYSQLKIPLSDLTAKKDSIVEYIALTLPDWDILGAISNAGNNIACLIGETWSNLSRPNVPEKNRPKNTVQHAQSNFSDNLSELRQWINLALQQGFDEQYITRILIARGWRLDIINRILGN